MRGAGGQAVSRDEEERVQAEESWGVQGWALGAPPLLSFWEEGGDS